MPHTIQPIPLSSPIRSANINRILEIVAKLDQEEAIGDTYVIYLQHAQAEDIVGLLTDLIASYQKSSDPKSAVEAQKISIQAHEATNALVIHAKDEQIKVIRSIVSQLDIRRAQVFVEAIIAEINEDRLGQLGISWEGTNVNSNGQISGGTEYDIGQAASGSVSCQDLSPASPVSVFLRSILFCMPCGLTVNPISCRHRTC